MVPFEQMAVDAIGPWSIKTNNVEVKTNAHSIIDTRSNLLELKRASQQNPTGKESVQVIEDTWLARHLKPVHVFHDQGTECRNVDFESFSSAKGSRASHALQRIRNQMPLLSECMM